uniref:Phage portal protein, lambda family n=1 Tax=uncultured marine virus TaxID=186617 RepID=A0A0F7L2E6_9VIRU|nr:phage portal protein, lambda family [uncultured marine virus]
MSLAPSMSVICSASMSPANRAIMRCASDSKAAFDSAAASFAAFLALTMSSRARWSPSLSFSPCGSREPFPLFAPIYRLRSMARAVSRIFRLRDCVSPSLAASVAVNAICIRLRSSSVSICAAACSLSRSRSRSRVTLSFAASSASGSSSARVRFDCTSGTPAAFMLAISRARVRMMPSKSRPSERATLLNVSIPASTAARFDCTSLTGSTHCQAGVMYCARYMSGRSARRPSSTNWRIFHSHTGRTNPSTNSCCKH